MSGYWDVTYDRYPLSGAPTRNVVQVEAATISMAREEGLRIIGSRSNLIRIDPAIPDVPVTNPADRKVQGT